MDRTELIARTLCWMNGQSECVLLKCSIETCSEWVCFVDDAKCIVSQLEKFDEEQKRQEEVNGKE